MKKGRTVLLLWLALIVLVLAVWGTLWLLLPKQETLDQRVHSIGEQLKCPICQGESVADSPSWLAQQMRGVIRQQVQEGKSDQEIIQYFQRSYGNQIVWSPQWQGFSLLAWLVPLALFLGSLLLIVFTVRDWRALSHADKTAAMEHEMLVEADDADLASYRQQLEQELIADDLLFEHRRMEAR